MKKALIGHSGFVGSTLKRQTDFDDMFRSTDIDRLVGMHFDTVFCAAAPGQKWLANANPSADADAIDGLIERLETMTCGTFVLVSTVDVFSNPRAVDESSDAPLDGLQPYGHNRRRLEMFVSEHFEQSCVVRLPGLVGPGLRKNVLYDLLHDNNLDMIDSRGIFQFYPMVNLWWDIQTVLRAGLRLIHLTAEPLDVSTLAREAFGRDFANELPRPVAQYDFRTSYSSTFGTSGDYQYSARDEIMAIRAYSQSTRNATRSNP